MQLQSALAADPRCSSNAARHESRDALRAVIFAAFAQLTAEQVVARLDEAQIANAHVNSMADGRAHPQLQARDRFRSVGSPAGAITALLLPLTSSGFGYFTSSTGTSH